MSSKSPIDPLFVLRGHKEEVTMIKFHPNNPKLLISGDVVGNLKIWDLETRRCTQEVVAHTHMLNMILKSDETLITQGREGIISFWNLKNISKPIHVVQLSQETQYSFCKFDYMVSNQVELLIAPVLKRIHIYDLKQESKMSSIDVDDEKLGMMMCFYTYMDQDIPHLMVGFESGQIQIWELIKFTKISEMDVTKEPILCIKQALGTIIVGSATNELILIKNGRIETKITIPEPGINQIDVCDKFFATAGWDHKVRIFDVKKPKLLAVLKYHTESVNSIQFQSPKLLASGSKDGRIAIWKVEFVKK